MQPSQTEKDNLLQRGMTAAARNQQPRGAIAHLDGMNPGKWLLIAQSTHYIATGLWPLVSMNSFERVTGPKTDKWLVKTVGVLVTAIGGTLAVSAARRTVIPEARLLAVASALGLAAIDVIYVAKRRIAPVYLLDAMAELALASAWGLAGTNRTVQGGGSREQAVGSR